MTQLERGGREWNKRMDQHLEVIRKGIQTNGWMIQGVFGDEDQPYNFVYTIGLLERKCAAEIMMVGLSLEAMHFYVNEIAAFTTANGGQPPSEWDLDAVQGTFVAKPVWVPRPRSPLAMGVAASYYGTDLLPTVQYVWPDDNHRYPWEPEWNPAMVQPVGGFGRPTAAVSE